MIRLSPSQKTIASHLFELGFSPRDAAELASRLWMTMDLVGPPAEHSYKPPVRMA